MKMEQDELFAKLEINRQQFEEELSEVMIPLLSKGEIFLYVLISGIAIVSIFLAPWFTFPFISGILLMYLASLFGTRRNDQTWMSMLIVYRDAIMRAIDLAAADAKEK